MITNLVEKNSTELNEIAAKLFATLDECEFFGTLAKYLSSSLDTNHTNVFIFDENSNLKQIMSQNKRVSKKVNPGKEISHLLHVVKTKRPYFSNNISRDPLFHGVSLNEEAILILPIVFEGVIISLMTFSGENKIFSVNDLTLALEILSNLEKPISNMKMFLTAQNLNAALLKRIQEAEQALANKDGNLDISKNFILSEEPFIVKSSKLRELVSYSDKLSSSDVSVLLQGKSGAGKEALAKRIHLNGPRAKAPFLIIDCASMESSKLDEEIFGKLSSNLIDIENVGMLELANKGTLLLKNVDKLSFPLQTKIAEFIKNKRAVRANSHQVFKSDVRIISTSKNDLEKMVLEGTYREDLYYLLSTVALQIPELKERLEDI